MNILKADILRTYNYTEGSKLKKIITCIMAPGVQAVTVFRYGGWISKQPKLLKVTLFPSYMFFNYLTWAIWGIEIQYTAQIGPGLYIGHFGGITISGLAKIGSNANIAPGTTIGISGEGAKRGVPIIGDNVGIAAGAKVYGKITIGNNVKIGPNAVIHKSLPDDTIALAPSFVLMNQKSNLSD